MNSSSKSSTLVRALRTVGWAMFGVRASKRHEEDIAALPPWVLILAAAVIIALFVGGLVTLATWVAKV